MKACFTEKLLSVCQIRWILKSTEFWLLVVMPCQLCMQYLSCFFCWHSFTYTSRTEIGFLELHASIKQHCISNKFCCWTGCANRLQLSSKGDAGSKQPASMGIFVKGTSVNDGSPTWTKAGQNDRHFYYTHANKWLVSLSSQNNKIFYKRFFVQR